MIGGIIIQGNNKLRLIKCCLELRYNYKTVAFSHHFTKTFLKNVFSSYDVIRLHFRINCNAVIQRRLLRKLSFFFVCRKILQTP